MPQVDRIAPSQPPLGESWQLRICCGGFFKADNNLARRVLPCFVAADGFVLLIQMIQY